MMALNYIRMSLDKYRVRLRIPRSAITIAMSSLLGLILIYIIHAHGYPYSRSRENRLLTSVYNASKVSWTKWRFRRPLQTSEHLLAFSAIPKVHVAVAVCGDMLGDLVVLVRSLLITSREPIVLHAFAERTLQRKLSNAISIWPERLKQKLELNIRDLFSPSRNIGGIPVEFWKGKFIGCPYQRLLLSEALPDVDRVIYVDVDTVFLSPVEELWAEFSKFSTNHFAGLAEEQLSGGPSYYDKVTSHPFYGKKGINSGVILIDLQKIRTTNFLRDIRNYVSTYKSNLTLYEQGALNVYFHFHQERMYKLSCVWNYRTDFCETSFTCEEARGHGVSLLHGNRRVNHRLTPFRAVYATFRDIIKKRHLWATGEIKTGDNVRHHRVASTWHGGVCRSFIIPAADDG